MITLFAVTDAVDKIAVDLSGAAETMLTTLYLKACDADFARPVLGDRFAKAAVMRLDYDFAGIGVHRRWAPLVTVRTAQYDIWAGQFLDAHPRCTVVHLGCGLDARVFRLDPGTEVAWFDVDYPAVIALRKQVYPDRPRYRLIAAAATDPSWLEQIPSDRPVLLLAEGVSMYLTEADGLALLNRVVRRFDSGELQIDFYSRFAIRSQQTQALTRRTGSALFWGVDGPEDVLDGVPGTRLLAATTFFNAVTFGRAAGILRAARPVVRLIPPVRGMVQYHRYGFGRAGL